MGNSFGCFYFESNEISEKESISTNEISVVKAKKNRIEFKNEEEKNGMSILRDLKIDEKNDLDNFSKKIQNRYRQFVAKCYFQRNFENFKKEEKDLIESIISKFSNENIKKAEKNYPIFELKNSGNYSKIDNKKIKIFSGRIRINEDSIYLGDMQIDSKKCGTGQLYMKEKGKYIGNFYNNCFHGWGRLINNDGSMIEGYFENNQLNSGEYKNLKNKHYKGEFMNLLPHGKGKELTKNYVYNGEFSQGLKQGKGCMKFPSGDLYEGDFFNGKINGEGKYTFKNLEIAEGSFSDGKLNGYACYYWPNGDIYKGFYKNNLKSGNGEFNWSSGLFYKGEFSDGNPHGKGILLEKGIQYNVEFINGKLKSQKKIENLKEPTVKQNFQFNPHQAILRTDYSQ